MKTTTRKQIYSNRFLLCDNCGKTVMVIKGVLNKELHDIICNNTRYVDNTEILCMECANKEVQ